MLVLNKNHKETDILRALVVEAKSGKKDKLFIKIDTLPEFMNSKVSFRVFLSQLSGYPRPVVWNTDDEYVFMLLHEIIDDKDSILSTLNYDQIIETRKQKIEEEKLREENEKKKAIEAEEELKLIKEQEQLEKEASDREVDNKPEPEINEVVSNETEVENIKEVLDTAEEIELEEDMLKDFQQGIPDRIEVPQSSPEKEYVPPVLVEADEPNYMIEYKESLPAEDVIATNSDVLDDIEVDDAGFVSNDAESESSKVSDDAHAFQQALNQKQDPEMDEWLDRISDTKVSISDSMSSGAFVGLDRLDDLKDRAATDPKSIFSRLSGITRSRALTIGAVLTVLSVMFVGSASSSLNVVTVNVLQDRVSESGTIQVPISNFVDTEFSASGESAFEAGGVDQTGLDIVTGNISLGNASDQELILIPGQFVLYNNGIKYDVVFDNFDPIVISQDSEPSSDNLMRLRSSVVGELAAVPSGDRFTINDLAGNIINDGLYAEAITDINLNETRSYATSEDVANLDLALEESLVAEVSNKVDEMKQEDEGSIYSKFWYIEQSQVLEPNIVQELFAASSPVASNTDVIIKSVPKSFFETELAKLHSDLESLDSINLIKTSNDFTQEFVDVEIEYAYLRPLDVTQEDISDALKNADGNMSEENYIISRFPSVNSVDFDKKGIIAPGFLKKSEVNIVPSS